MIIIFKNILFSIYAGIAITIAGAVNLIVGGLPGAILFAIGLLVVINYKELLFTGQTAKLFLPDNKGKMLKFVGFLILCWLGNFLGAIIAGNILLWSGAGATLATAAAGVMTKYVALKWWQLLCGAIFCGMLVCFATGKPMSEIMVIFCVIVFVISGFPHCIATMGYWVFAGSSIANIWVLLPITIGNIIGSWMLVPLLR